MSMGAESVLDRRLVKSCLTAFDDRSNRSSSLALESWGTLTAGGHVTVSVLQKLTLSQIIHNKMEQLVVLSNLLALIVSVF